MLRVISKSAHILVCYHIATHLVIPQVRNSRMRQVALERGAASIAGVGLEQHGMHSWGTEVTGTFKRQARLHVGQGTVMSAGH